MMIGRLFRFLQNFVYRLGIQRLLLLDLTGRHYIPAPTTR